ncbi:hypothetical protein [Pelagicoccus mobilis]|uniref:DUF7133 domain-containing protein n=1 Tax=Pelagicoccus mobilis TaxID=415221 RepID=A0A934VTL5_9BACT|nr:hypothetical protein [Pelagicoccus mobilis]MBK1879848.1 hypothetical protein [Pelagicoccus mobilis]
MKAVFLIVLSSLIPSAFAESYKVETIEFPLYVAPEVGGIDFTPDGEIVVALRRYGVLMARPTEDPTAFPWRVFSEDILHNACGLQVISKDEIILSQMAELTRLRDTDGDGIADSYENISDQWGVSGNYHETNTIVSHPDGGWYIAIGTASHNGPTFYKTRGEFSDMGRLGRNFSGVQWKGWVLRLDEAGNATPFASGFRMHNGIGLSPSGQLFATDNQGDWRGTSPLYLVEEGNFYGHPSSLVWDEAFTSNVSDNPLQYFIDNEDAYEAHRTRAAVELPQGFMCNSPSQPLFDTTDGAFGPFAGQVFIGDIAGARIIRCMLEEVDGFTQGACVKFIDHDLRPGNNRLAFSPDGKSLYTGQTVRGWGKPSEGMQRITFTGEMPFEVQSMSLSKDGFELRFTKAVDPQAASDIANYAMKRYWYKSTHAYGSPQHDLTDILIRNVTLGKDGRSVHLKVDGLQKKRIFELNLGDNIVASDGTPLTQPQTLLLPHQTPQIAWPTLSLTRFSFL